MSTLVFFLLCFTGWGEAKPFSGYFRVRQPGITYQVFLEELPDGQVRGVLNTPILSLPIIGQKSGDVASGDLVGLAKLGFLARLKSDKLIFDILHGRAKPSQEQVRQSLVMLPITDENEQRQLKKTFAVMQAKLEQRRLSEEKPLDLANIQKEKKQ